MEPCTQHSHSFNTRKDALFGTPLQGSNNIHVASEEQANWESSYPQQQDTLFRLMGCWTDQPAENFEDFSMEAYLLQEASNQPLTNKPEMAQELGEDWAGPVPGASQSVKHHKTSPECSPRPGTATLGAQDVGLKELPNSFINSNIQPGAGGRKRRTTQRIRKGEGEIRPAKRHHQAAFPGPIKETDEAGFPVAQPQTQDGEDTQAYILACPFYKKNLHVYNPCLGYHLRRIKDVKQHIYRKHSKPDFYCSRCFTVFFDARSRDAHTRLASCEVQTDPQHAGISEDQKKRLTQYASRSKGIHEQWFDIWDIIFPGEQRPKSVYVGSYLEEAVPLLRAFWDDRQLEIISVVAQTGNVENTAKDTLKEVMGALLDHFEKETSRTVEQAADITPKWSEAEPEAVFHRRSGSDDNYTEGTALPSTATEFYPALCPFLNSHVAHQSGGFLIMSENVGSPQFLVPDQLDRSLPTSTPSALDLPQSWMETETSPTQSAETFRGARI
ncbi:hypothetical protein QQS21_003770 [Conoideocrella luteorostrata]|uniref:C2H2-type domain-containing protein n=1 Tax=Conoideocrella luteorostrata TaxID=1105319 RepID=A0AAJ0CSM6_9HYPO|nr:hypothetical protein QQS21_003770 [Conoideocrella luteorostrata]